MRAADLAYFDRPPLALAHRGGAGYPPNRGLENSMAAFSAAVHMGYRYLETDVHLSADGHLVAFHDDRLDPITTSQGPLARRPVGEITAALIGGREPVPTLEDVLTALPDVRLNIDLKAPGTAVALWRTIRRHDAHQRVCVGSFVNRRLWQFRLLSRGRVATAAGRLGVVALRFLPAPLTKLVHSPAAVYQVPSQVSLLGRTVPVVTAGFVRRAHGLGKQVHVWTIDDPAEMVRLLDLGVDGLVTDRIDLLKDVLTARGGWVPHGQ